MDASLHPPTLRAHGCATCKPAAMPRLNTTPRADGLRRRRPVGPVRRGVRDTVFAKDLLAAYCDGGLSPHAVRQLARGELAGERKAAHFMNQTEGMSDKTETELLQLERKYCSWGDTVHYLSRRSSSSAPKAATCTTATARRTSICRCGTRRPTSGTATAAEQRAEAAARQAAAAGVPVSAPREGGAGGGHRV